MTLNELILSDVQAAVPKLKESFAKMYGIPVERVKLVGLSLHFVDEETGSSMIDNIYMTGYDPEDYE